MNPQQQQEFDAMKKTVEELSLFIRLNFNADGTPKAPPLVLESQDTNTTPAGSIRVQTNLGPRNILVTA